jgi:hypothetical protein
VESLLCHLLQVIQQRAYVKTIKHLLERNIGNWCCFGHPLLDRRAAFSSVLLALAVDAGGGEAEREQSASHVISVL